jgi:hypothetical protein
MLSLLERGAHEGVEVFVLSQAKIDEVWPFLEMELDAEPDLWSAWFTKEGIFLHLTNDMMQLWTVCEKDGPIKGLFLTRMQTTEIEKVLHVFWMRAVGLPKGTFHRISLVLDVWGHAQGCTRIAVLGREGWKRALMELAPVRN